MVHKEMYGKYGWRWRFSKTRSIENGGTFGEFLKIPTKKMSPLENVAYSGIEKRRSCGDSGIVTFPITIYILYNYTHIAHFL